MKMTSGSIAKIAAALHSVQGQLTAVSRSSDGYNYKFADLASCWELVRKPLHDNGLALMQTTRLTEGEQDNVMITTLLHTSGEWLSGEMLVRPVKNDPQSLGSSLSYARRYGMMAILGISASDDDGAAASAGKPAPSKPEPSKPKATTKAFRDGYKKCLDMGASASSLPKLRPDDSQEKIDAAVAELRKIFTALNQEPS